jgi:hypothetical protein
MRILSFKLMIATVALSTLFVACKKDDKVETKNSFIYQNNTYDVSNGFISNYGKRGAFDATNFDIYLTSKAITNTGGDISGTGDAIYLDFNSASATELASGTYTFDDLRNLNTFSNAIVYINCNFNTFTGGEYEIDANTTGSIIVNKTGSTYEISCSFTVDNGKEVDCYYKGSLASVAVKKRLIAKKTVE